MEKSAILERLGAILARVLKHDKFILSEDLTANEVEGWDSLSHISIISEVEREFNIKFKLKELNKMKNIGSLAEMVASKL